MLSILHVLDILAGGCIIYLLKTILSTNRSLPLPPGPKGYPLIGNLLDLPTEREWETYARWSEKYGNIMSMKLLGQPFIILSSPKAAFDLLDKRGAIYSDRPRFEMAGEIVGYAKAAVMCYYGERLRTYRRMLRECIGTTRPALEQFMPLMETSAHKFLLSTLRKPEKFHDHLRWMTSATILSITYGYESPLGDDRFLSIIDHIVDDFVALFTPGAFLVDSFPWLRYVPSWFPGTGWQRKAEQYRKTIVRGITEPYEWTKREMAAGTAVPSFASNGLERGGYSAQNEEYVKYSAMSIMAAGADTSAAVIHSFVLAMTLYPEVQKKAQAEIDAVVGNDRLPTISQDWDNLPYLRAVCSEVLRWMPAGPMALPHRLMEDDVYEGYFLPKGSIIFVNSWKIMHDPVLYHDPMEFIPERFIARPGYEPEMDPASFAFGYGRRMCPGMHVAEATIFLVATMSLATFNITPVVKDGKPVPPVARSAPGFVCHPMPFECDIKPRSAKAESLILQANEA